MSQEEPPAKKQTTKQITDQFKQELKGVEGRNSMEKAVSLLTGKASDGVHSKPVNRWDLLPHMFRIKGEPFSLKDYPQFEALYGYNYVPNQILLCGRQVSKSFPLSELHKLRMSDGTRMTPDRLAEGEWVQCVDKDDKATTGRIAEVFDSGVKDIVKITTRTGCVIRSSHEHRHRTVRGYTPAGDLAVGDRLGAVRRVEHIGSSAVDIGRVAITAFLIGDGHIGGKSGTGFTTGDAEVRDAFLLHAKEYSHKVLDLKSSNCWRVTFHRNQAVDDWMRADGLHGTKSGSKFIPAWVFKLPLKQAQTFVECLWATDGMIKMQSNGPAITYTSISETLAHDLKHLLLHFGIHGTIKRAEAGYTTDGVYTRRNDAFTLRVDGRGSQRAFTDTFTVPGKPSIEVPAPANSNRDTIPKDDANYILDLLFKDAQYNRGDSLRTWGLRKTAKYSLSVAKQDAYLAYAEHRGLQGNDGYKLLHRLRHGDLLWDEVVAVEYQPAEPCVDIAVVEHHNFIMDGIVTHNSTNLSRSEVMDAIQISNFQQLYVSPLQSQAQRFSTLYLSEAIQSCTAASQLQDQFYAQFLDDSQRGDIGLKKTIMHQTFLNGSSLMMSYAKSDSDRARGITADRIDFDEIQDQLVDNLPIISESLSNSKWGCRRFTGTAKTNDNTIEYLWGQSSQSEWVVQCMGCRFYNIPNIDHHALKMIGVHGPICAKCGKALDVRIGKLVSAYPDLDNEFQGIRVGQISLPAMVEDPVKWANIVRKIATLPEATVLNEIFGISCDFGVRLITQADLDRNSNLGTHEELYERRHQYVHRVIGVDWGIAEITSFTVVSVMGITPDGELHCLYGHRYVGVNVEDIIPDIVDLYLKYECEFCAPDFGVGYLNNTMLSNRGLNVVQCQYVTQNKFMSPREQHGITVWTVDRNTALGTIFHNIRSGKMRFCNKDVSDDYVKDMLSPYEELIEKSSGIHVKKFLRAPALPDDFCHASTFACMVLWYLTGSPMLHTVPEHSASQSIESQWIDSGDYDTENHDDATDIDAIIRMQAGLD